MEVQQNQGSKMLKVTGILMIIGGALALVIALIAVIGIAAAASLAAGALGGGIIALAVIASILSLLGGGIELAAGILGVKNWNQPAKAQSCIVFGAIIIALSVLSNILNWLPVPNLTCLPCCSASCCPCSISSAPSSSKTWPDLLFFQKKEK